jgi:hypothetical protein
VDGPGSDSCQQTYVSDMITNGRGGGRSYREGVPTQPIQRQIYRATTYDKPWQMFRGAFDSLWRTSTNLGAPRSGTFGAPDQSKGTSKSSHSTRASPSLSRQKVRIMYRRDHKDRCKVSDNKIYPYKQIGWRSVKPLPLV